MFMYQTAVGLKLQKHSQRKGRVTLFYKADVHQNHLSVNFYLSITVKEETQVQSVTRFIHIVWWRMALDEGEKTHGRCHRAKWSADKIKCEDTKGVLQDQNKIIQPKPKKRSRGRGVRGSHGAISSETNLSLARQKTAQRRLNKSRSYCHVEETLWKVVVKKRKDGPLWFLFCHFWKTCQGFLWSSLPTTLFNLFFPDMHWHRYKSGEYGTGCRINDRSDIECLPPVFHCLDGFSAAAIHSLN